MKVAHAEKHVLGTGGLQESQAFKMRANAHAFKMLSSGMYSDKITAVLREIGCNAHDAHIAQGVPSLPFEVKLPNQLDNQFYIRDHGTGLAHDDVMNLYTTYFASTKQESNEFTGAFGLGSKSPFSYTDSFTVTACHEGTKRIYSAHVGNEGVPIIALMSEGPADADWQTGIEVGFPVKPEDFTDFSNKAAKVFRFFNPLPKVAGSRAPIRPLVIEKDFGTYAFLDRNDDDFANGITIQMGNVKYPLETDQLRANHGPVLERAKELRGLLLRFKLGELQITGSREGLQYDPVTQKVVADRLVEVLKDIAGEIKKAYDAADTWLKLCAFKKMRDTVSRGISLNKEFFEMTGIKGGAKLAEVCSWSYFTLPAVPVTARAGYVVLKMERSAGVCRMRVQRPAGVASRTYIDYDEDVIIVQGDETNSQGRIRKAFIDSVIPMNTRVVLVVPKRKDDGDQNDVNAVLPHVTSAFKGVPVSHLSAYPAPPLLKYSRKKKGGTLPPLPAEDVTVNGSQVKISDVVDKVYVIRQSTHSWGRRSGHWYIGDTSNLKNAKKIDTYTANGIAANISKLRKSFPDIGLVLPAEVAPREARRYGLKKRPDWKTLEAHVHERLVDPDSIKALKAVVEDVKFVVDLESFHYDSHTGFLENMVRMKHKQTKLFEAIEPVLKKHGVLRDIEEVHKNSKTRKSKRNGEPEELEAYRNLASELNVALDVPAFHEATQNIDDKYPQAAKVTWSTFITLHAHAPEVLPAFVDAVLKRG